MRQTVAHRVRERGERLRGERRRRRPDGDPQPPAVRTGGEEHIRTGRGRCVHAVAALPGDRQRPAALRAQGGEVQIGEEELCRHGQPVGQQGQGPLVGPRLGGLGGDAPQIVLETRAVGTPGRRTRRTQGNRRGEGTEHPVCVGQGMVPAAHRETEHQIRPAGGGRERPVVGGEHRGVEGGSGACGEPAQRLHLVGFDREPAGVEERVAGAAGGVPVAGVPAVSTGGR